MQGFIVFILQTRADGENRKEGSEGKDATLTCEVHL